MKGSTEFSTSGKRTAHEVVNLMSIASFMRKGAKVDNCKITFTWKVITEDVRASIIATTPLLETVPAVAIPPSPSSEGSLKAFSAEKVKQVSSFIEQGIVDMDDEDDDSEANESDSHGHASPKIPRPANTAKPSQSQPTASVPTASGGLHDHLHQIATAESFDDNESSATETASHLGSESGQSEDMHSVHEFDENDMQTWLVDQQHKLDEASPAAGAKLSAGIAASDSFSPQVASFYRNVGTESDDNTTKTPGDDATSLFLSNVEESDDDDDGYALKPLASVSSAHTPSPSTKATSLPPSVVVTAAMKTPNTPAAAAAVAASDINPFLANVEDDDEDDEEEVDQMAVYKSPFPSGNDLAPVATSSRLSSSSQSPKNSQQKVRFSGSLRSTSKEAPPPPQPVVAPAGSNKATTLATTTNSATAAVEKIESVIDSETEELIIHSVRRAQSFKTDTLDHVPPISPRSGRTSPLPPTSTSTSTSSATANTVAQPVTPVPIIKAKVEMDPLVSIELPTKEDVDDLFREVSEMRSHMEHEMKRNDAECKFLESQLQLLLDTPVTDGDTLLAQDMRQQYDHQRKRLHELEHLRMAEINQLQVKWLKIKEVGHLMHQEAVQARSLIFAEENKAKAFYNHYHHLKETIDQAHLHIIHMQREEELQAMYTWSEDVVNRLETLELFEKEFQKIRERYEGVTYFIPEFVLHLVKPVVAPPVPPPVAEVPTSPSPSLSPSPPSPPPRANAEMAVSAPLTPVPPPPPPPPPMDAPPVLTPKPTVSKTLSQRMSVFQPPAVSAANSSSSTTTSSSAASLGTETSSEATAASTSQGDKPVAVAKKRLKGELGALVNEVLVRRGSACPYGVPPKRHSESNGGEEGESLQSIADAAMVQSQPFLSVSIPSPPPPPPPSSQSQQALPPKPAATSSALRSIFMSADDSGHHESTALDDSVDANRPSPWSTDTGLMTPMASDQAHMSFTPFSPIASGAERRGSETESIFTTDDRHTPVLDSSMSKLAQKRLSLSDRKKSRSSMSGMASPVPNHEAIRVVTSLTKSLKKKYTSDNLADLVAMSRAANGGNNGSDPTKNGSNSPDKQSPIKRDSLPKTPEKEELPELEGVLDLPEIPLSAVVVVSPKSADAHHQSSSSSTTSSNNLKPFPPPPPQPPAAGGVTTSATATAKTGAKALSLNTSHLTEDLPPTKLLSPAQKALLADISSTSSSSDDRNRAPPPPPPSSSSSSMGGLTAPMTNTATKSTADASRPLSPIPAVQPKLNFTKLDASGGARTVSPVFATKEEDLSAAEDNQPSTGKDSSIKNMKYFYQGVLDIVGDGIRSGVLRVFRIMELTLVSSSSSSSATSSAGGGGAGGGTSSSGAATPSGANEYKGEGSGPNGSGGNNNSNKRRSSVANAGGTPSSNSGTPTAASLRNTLIQNALTQRRKAMNMGLSSSDSPSELSRSPSNDTLNGGGGSGTPSMVNGGGGERGRTMSRDSISPDKSMPKSHVSILPQLPFYDTKTLLDTLAQKNLQGDLQLKHHAMVMLSNTLHLNNIEDMLIHVRALNDAHAILTNNDTELISGKLWDISHLFQAARVLIHLFGTEAAHGRGSVSGTVADHEHALTMDAAAAYQALRGLKEELQRCFLLQNAALSANARRGSLKRRTGDMPDPVSPSPRTSIIRGSLLIVPNNNRYQPITVATLISESEGLQAQMLSTLLPHNMAVAELMVRLLAFRDGLLTQSRQYKSLGRREIYKFLKKFGFAIEQQLDLDVHAQNMEVSSQAKPIATQIASALEELDKVEQEANAKATSSSSSSASATATATSAPPSLAPTTPANLAQQNPVLANKLQQQQSLASGSNHTNQTNAGRFCLDRMRTLVVHADEVLYRMRLMKETLLSLAANDSESESEYEDDDTIDDERLDERDDLSVTYSVGGVSQFSGGTGFTSRTRATTAAAGGMTPHGNPTTAGTKPLSNRMRRTRDKEALERAMHDMVMNRDELKKKVTAMMTSTMSEDVDVLIKSNVTTEESLANKLFDATFRKDDASVAVLLLRSHNVAVLRSIYATWPGLVFDIALTEPVVMPTAALSSTAGNGSVPLRPGHQYSSGSPLITRSASLNMSNGMSRGGGALSLTSPGGGPTPSSASNHPMLHGMMRSTGSPLRGGTSVAGSHHPGIAGMMSPAAGGVGHRPGVAVNLRSSFDHESEAGGSFSSHQQGLRGLSSPSKNVMMGSGGGGGSMPLPGSCSVEIVYQKHWSKDIDTLVVDFSDTRLLRNLGFKLIQLRDSRMYSWTDLLNAGYPLAEIKPLRVSAAASSAQGGSGSSAMGSNIASTSNMGNGIPSSYNDPSDPLGKLTSGFKLSVDELRTAGYSIEQCLQAGFDATALRAGGFNELQLVQSGLFTMKQLKKAGCDVQRFALKALFEATNGKHWRRRDGWCSNLPLSEWFGVKLDGAGNVVRIDLRSNELSGKCALCFFLSFVVCMVLYVVVLHTVLGKFAVIGLL